MNLRYITRKLPTLMTATIMTIKDDNEPKDKTNVRYMMYYQDILAVKIDFGKTTKYVHF
jgi:hypothetical protein